MKSKKTIMGIVGALLSASCIYLYSLSLNQEIENERNELISRYGGEQVEVLIAKRDIGVGETLDSFNCQKQVWIVDLLPQNAVTDFAVVAEQKTSSPIYAGEIITEKRLGNNDSSLSIPDGYVALSIPAREINAVGGAISVGSAVDVYAVGTNTTCIGTNVKVLATSNSFASSSQGAITWITVAITPDQVQEFITTAENLEFYFVLPPQNPSMPTQESHATDSNNSLSAHESEGDDL